MWLREDNAFTGRMEDTAASDSHLSVLTHSSKHCFLKLSCVPLCHAAWPIYFTCYKIITLLKSYDVFNLYMGPRAMQGQVYAVWMSLSVCYLASVLVILQYR